MSDHSKKVSGQGRNMLHFVFIFQPFFFIFVQSSIFIFIFVFCPFPNFINIFFLFAYISLSQCIIFQSSERI